MPASVENYSAKFLSKLQWKLMSWENSDPSYYDNELIYMISENLRFTLPLQLSWNHDNRHNHAHIIISCLP